jgi:hypothetical protein
VRTRLGPLPPCTRPAHRPARPALYPRRYKQYANLLGGHLSAIDTIIAKVDQTLGAFDSLLSLHKEVSQRSQALSSSCEQIVAEKEAMVQLADALRAKLKFFDEFESVFQQFHAAQLSLDNEHFLPLLKRLDECIAYVSSNPQYADANSYAGKFRQLQGRALGMVKTKVQQVLRHAIQQVGDTQAWPGRPGRPAACLAWPGLLAAGCAAGRAPPPDALPPGLLQVQAAISNAQEGGGAPGASPLKRGGSGSQKLPVLAEGADVSLLYVRFRAAAEPSLKGGRRRQAAAPPTSTHTHTHTHPPPRPRRACAGACSGAGTGITALRLTPAAGAARSTAGLAGHAGPPLKHCAPDLRRPSPRPHLPTSHAQPLLPLPAGLFKELESRSQRSEYRRLLAECQAVYSQARLQLVAPFVQQRVASLAPQPVPVLMRSGYEYLLRVRGACPRRPRCPTRLRAALAARTLAPGLQRWRRHHLHLPPPTSPAQGPSGSGPLSPPRGPTHPPSPPHPPLAPARRCARWRRSCLSTSSWCARARRRRRWRS